MLINIFDTDNCIQYKQYTSVAGSGVRAGAGLRVRAADLLRVAARDVALHAGRGRALRPRHLLLGKLRQGRVRAYTTISYP